MKDRATHPSFAHIIILLLQMSHFESRWSPKILCTNPTSMHNLLPYGYSQQTNKQRQNAWAPTTSEKICHTFLPIPFLKAKMEEDRRRGVIQ
jgi:hypothetical protein